MKKIVLEIDVQDGDLDALNSSLNRTEENFRDVDQAANKTAKSVDDVASNGGAIAILDSFTGGLATRMRDAFEATKLFNLSLKGTRTALISTGIGVFVVALGAVVAYWNEIVEFVTEANKRLQIQIDLNKRNLEVLDGEMKLLDSKEKLLITEGKSTTKIRKEKQAILLLQQAQNQSLIDNLTIQLQRQKALVKEVSAWEKIKIAFLTVTQQSGAAATAVAESVLGSTEQKKILDELAKGLLDAQIRANDLKIALFNLLNPSGEKRDKEGVAAKGLSQGEDNRISTVRSELEALALLDIEFLEQQFLRQLAADARANKRAKESAEERVKIAELEAQAKLAAQAQFASSLGAILGNIASLFGEATAASKIAALAEIAIGTGVGFIQGLDIAQKGAKATGPAAPFAFPIFYATQIAAVLGAASKAKNILSSVKGGGGGFSLPSFGGGTGSTGGSIPSPEFNVVGNTGINQLQGVIEDGLTQPVRAYVLNGDVQKASEIENNSIQEATV